MLAVGQDTAALFDPLQIDHSRNVILDPDQEHDHEAEHERKRQIVMGVFGVSRHGRERFGAEQRHNQDTAKADIEARKRKHDEAARRQPVGKAFEAGETQDFCSREAVIDANASAHHQEDRQQDEHPEDGDTANDRQFAALKVTPVAARGLDQVRGICIRDADPPADLVAVLQRIQELIFLDSFGRRFEGKLRRCWVSQREQQHDSSA